LWTIANREDQWVDGPILRLHDEDEQIYLDLIRGVQVEPLQSGAQIILPGVVGPRGVGAIAAIPRADLPLFESLLSDQTRLYARSSWDTRFPGRCVAQHSVRRAPQSVVPDGMIGFPGGQVHLTSTYRERECGTYEEHPYNLDYEDYQYDPERHFDLYGAYTRTVDLAPFALDAQPVSNDQFAAFVLETGYAPRHPEHFLEHWGGNTAPPGIADQAVVYVGFEDARAYAAWSGKRLPSEEEWQYAMESGLFTHETPRVWQWTDSERSDGRTRWCLIKGGADYQAMGSMWYADGGPKDPAFSAKFILLWPGIDRCATIGFRCAVDLPARGPYRRVLDTPE
jgi:hypothetical protein